MEAAHTGSHFIAGRGLHRGVHQAGHISWGQLTLVHTWMQAGDCVVVFTKQDIYRNKKEIETTTSHKACVVSALWIEPGGTML